MKPPEDAESRPPAGAADPKETHHSPRQDSRPDADQVNTADRPGQLPLPGMGEPAENGWTSFEFAAAIEQCARQGTPFTSADVRKLVPGEPKNPNLIGLEFAHAARAGVIVPLAAVQSPVPSRRRGLCRIWQGAA